MLILTTFYVYKVVNSPALSGAFYAHYPVILKQFVTSVNSAEYILLLRVQRQRTALFSAESQREERLGGPVILVGLIS